MTRPGTGTVRLGGRKFAARWGVRSRTGKGHDRVLCTDGFAAIADGATPLGADWPDAGTFAESALASLRDAARDESRPLTAVWASAIADTAARTGAEQPRSSCSVAAVWQVGRALELSVLGDCTAVVDTVDDRLVLHDATVPRLDATAALVPAADRAAAVLRNRTSMNTPYGYWIFATDPSAADHVRHLRIDTLAVRSILLYTDGLQPLVAPGRSAPEVVAEWGATWSFADDASFVLVEPARP